MFGTAATRLRVSVLTTHLRVWCTYEVLTNQGEMYQYIDHAVYINIEVSHYPNKHIILYIFYAPGYDSNCIIKLVQTLISKYI